MILYWLLRPIVFILEHIPFFILRAISKTAAAILWHTSKKRRKTAIKNAEILGAKDPVFVARKSVDYTFMAYIDMVKAHSITQKFVDKYVDIEGFEIYEKVKKETDNIVFLGGHFGAWSLTGTIFYKATGIKLITIGRSTYNKSMDKLLDYLRTFDGVAYINHKGAMAKLGEYIAKGYHAGVFLDHIAPDKDCIYAPFCNYKVPVIAGIPMFAVRKNSPILFFFCMYSGSRLKMFIKGPIYPNTSLPVKERLYKLICDINNVYEEVYRKYPEQWYLIHRRFKRIKDDNDNLIPNIYE